MATLLLRILTGIAMISTLSSQTHICDQSQCDFGNCNPANYCGDSTFICTDKASTCAFKCLSNCSNINITSSAEYTEIVCHKDACTDIQILVQQPDTILHLNCKQSLSCSNIKIYTDHFSLFHCTDNDDYQCSNQVQIQYTTLSPTLNPTVIPTIIPTLYPTINPTFLPLTSEAATEDIAYVTKTIVMYAQHTRPESYPFNSLIIALISVSLFCFCVSAIVCVKMCRNDDKIMECNAVSESIQNANMNEMSTKQGKFVSEFTDACYDRRSSEGNQLKVIQMQPMEGTRTVSDTDQLYEGNHTTQMKYNNEHVIHENTDVGIIIMEVELDALELPKSPVTNGNSDAMIGSISCCDSHLLYGAGGNKTLGSLPEIQYLHE